MTLLRIESRVTDQYLIHKNNEMHMFSTPVI